MIHGYIYKTTINNADSSLHQHFYIGQHRKSVFDDKYFGSGYKIANYIHKYGTDSLSIEVLEWAYAEDEINELEAKYVHDGILKDEMCLNLITGGKFRTWSLESRMKATLNMLGVKNHRYGTHHTEEYKKIASIRGRQFRHKPETIEIIRNKRNDRGNSFYTPEVRKKMSDQAKITKNATGYKWTKEQIKANKIRLILSTNKIKKIQNDDLPTIEKMLNSGMMQYEVAKIYNVAPRTISRTHRIRIPEFKKIRPEIFK